MSGGVHSLSSGVEVAWVAHYGSNSAPSKDEPIAIVTDPVGNIYVTGSSNSSFTGLDYLTIKYNPSGEERWTARYSGPGCGDDRPHSVAVDRWGNVYVAGESYGLGSQCDYATIKYDPSGREMWVVRYNGPGNGDDRPRGLYVDASGNVIVTGESRGRSGDLDFATIKYDSQGVEQWVARYNGPGNGDDRASALGVDGSGNVYVTGESDGSGTTSSDYATVQYSAGGVELWVVRYNGPGNGRDWPCALALGNSGTVFVTGGSCGSDNLADVATIKYSAEGIIQWVARFDTSRYQMPCHSTHLSLDACGNVYVTGSAYPARQAAWPTFHDLTIKYDNSGRLQWAIMDLWNVFPPVDFAVDDSGNVYLAGGFIEYLTVKLTTDGAEEWRAYYRGTGDGWDVVRAMTVDRSGNMYVTGSSDGGESGKDYATVRYNPSGLQLWAMRYDGPGNSLDFAVDIAVDDSANVLVTGDSKVTEDVGSGFDFLTVKYNSSGAEEWVERSAGPDWQDRAGRVGKVLAVDNSGNAYTAGWTKGDGGEYDYDYVTIKYNTSGSTEWVARFDGLGHGPDISSAITVNDQGNVFVTGWADMGSGDYTSCTTVKYDASGVEQWVSSCDGDGDGVGMGIVSDDSGNVYVTGMLRGGDTNDDYVTLKYNAAGEEQWVARYNGTGNDRDWGLDLALDDSGNVCVTGLSQGGTSGTDCATVKYSRAGVEVWVERYGGLGNDRGKAILCDNLGNVYVMGTYWPEEGNSDCDYATMKYDPSGQIEWVVNYNGPGNGSDVPVGFGMDGRGNIYVTGLSKGLTTGYDFATVKYNASGVEEWVARYSGPGEGEDRASALALDCSGNIYVTGWSSVGHSKVYTTLKYVQVPVAVTETTSDSPIDFFLSQNYPNPFNPGTTMKFTLPRAGFVTLKVYNVLGEEVATLAAGDHTAGTSEVTWDASGMPSGVYFYRLTAGEHISVGKMVLMK